MTDYEIEFELSQAQAQSFYDDFFEFLPQKPLVLFSTSYDYGRNQLLVHPLGPEDVEWVRANQHFLAAVLQVLIDEYAGQKVTRAPNDPTLCRILNRFIDVLKAMYPHTDFSAVLQFPA